LNELFFFVVVPQVHFFNLDKFVFYCVQENQKTKVPVCPGEGKTRHGMLDLDDGAVEELLFGWFEGQNR
jgi:hypothetical protein